MTGRRAAITLLCVCTLFGGVAVGTAAAQNEPAWVAYERGRQAFRAGEFGDAVRMFRRAIEQGGPYPEAEAAIGEVYLVEGSLNLAERQFQRAIRQRGALAVPEDEFLLWYRLAEVYELLENPHAYELALREIVERDERYVSEEYSGEREGYRRVIREEGLDRLLVLYRQPDDFARKAHALLGEHYLRTGSYGRAVEHLLFANIKILTELIEVERERDPGYEFTTVAGLLDRVEQRREMREYIGETGLYRAIYYLGSALYSDDPSLAGSRAIWEIVAEREAAGDWARRAAEQIADPSLEPLIDH